jgi:chorismate mutase
VVTARLEHPPAALPRLRAVRGAVTVDADSPALIDAAVRELLDHLSDANAIDAPDLVSAIFSATPDLRSRNPATAARALGWTDVPMMCVAEVDTDGMLDRCIRVLLHVSVVDGRRLRPVYLGAAAHLRPDLAAVPDANLRREPDAAPSPEPTFSGACA